MTRRIITLLVYIVILWSCSPYKKIYIPITKYDSIERLNRVHHENINANEAYLTFTKNFDKEQIKIFKDGELITDSILSTGSRGILGIANSFKINKKAIISIQFKYCEKRLTIFPEDMKEYKFIYIEKKRKNKYLVEFNNSKKLSDD